MALSSRGTAGKGTGSHAAVALAEVARLNALGSLPVEQGTFGYRHESMQAEAIVQLAARSSPTSLMPETTINQYTVVLLRSDNNNITCTELLE